MIIPAAIVLFIIFAGSYFGARQLAINKNRQPNMIILIGLLIGIVAFGAIWAASTVFGGPLARLAAIAVFAAMPVVVAAIVPPRN
ncbi:MAG: hypothetical protein OXR67_06210 [Chloroflexota bacterium]|nr:hypothetical protein [Chloroflexota bacterium]